MSDVGAWLSLETWDLGECHPPDSHLDGTYLAFTGQTKYLQKEQALRKPWELLRPEGSQKLS